MIELFLGNNLVKPSYARFLVLGSILGIASIIIVFSLFANYYQAVEQLLMGVNPHLSLHKEAFSSADWERTTAALAESGELVVAFEPAIDLTVNSVVSAVESFPVVCVDEAGGSSCFDFEQADRHTPESLRGETGFEIEKTRVANLRLRGIVVAGGASLTDVHKVMDVRTSADDLDRLNLGPDQGMPMACLFERTFFHGAGKLDDFLVTLPGVDGGPGRHFRLLSTINLGMKQGEHPLFITSLEHARTMLDRPGFYNTIEVRLRDPYAATDLAKRLQAVLAADGVTVRTWIEMDAGSFRLLEVLRRVIFIVIFSVMVVAALGIISALSLVVMENRRKIAILRAMGLRDLNIYLALIIKCWKIACGGLVAGIAAGYAGSALLLWVPGFRQGLAKMGILEPGVLIEPRDVALLAAATLLLYFIVAMIPARDACRIDAVEGLQS